MGDGAAHQVSDRTTVSMSSPRNGCHTRLTTCWTVWHTALSAWPTLDTPTNGRWSSPSGFRSDNGFHVFTTEWMPYQINYLLDGVAYGTVSLANIGYTDQWEMEQPIRFQIGQRFPCLHHGMDAIPD